MKATNANIGKCMRIEREKRDITLQQVADYFGCNRSAVHNWEVGKRTIKAADMIAYLEFLGINPDEFIKEYFHHER